MGEHRKIRRGKGVRVAPGSGRRRRSGVLEEPSSAREVQRAARKAQRSVAWRRIGLASLAAVVLVGSAVAATLLTNSGSSTSTTLPPGSIESSSLLLVGTGQDGGADLIAMVGVDGTGATVVLLEPGLVTLLPGFGDRPLADMSRFGFDDLPRLTVANLLGVRVDGTATVPITTFGALLPESLRVDLPREFVVQQDDAQVIEVPAGEVELTADQVVQLLSDPGMGTQLEWLDRQGAILRALVETSGEQLVDVLAGSLTGPDPDAARQALVGLTATSNPQLSALPAQRIERAGGDVELYQISAAAVDEFVAARFPGLRFTTETRPRVEVLNGNGRIGTTRPVAAALIGHGFRIVRTDNADHDDYAETRIVAQGRDHQEDALRVRQILGRGEVLVEVRQPSGVVDLTIIVGQDIPAEEV